MSFMIRQQLIMGYECDSEMYYTDINTHIFILINSNRKNIPVMIFD